MGYIRVITGNLKGRIIPFSNKKFDNADITPQKVKGAVFSMLGEFLTGRGFLDIFSGSGQIGIEALSRGADPVVLNEQDRHRFQFIASFLQDIGQAGKPVLLNLSWSKALEHLASRDFKFYCIFLDPPYQKKQGGILQYSSILKKIGDCGVLEAGGKIVIQHFSASHLDEEAGPYHLETVKKYGTTSLSFYRT